MKKNIIILAFVLGCGCATLQSIMEEARQIKSEDIQPYSNSVGVLIDGLVPARYGYPIVYALGWGSELLRRLCKRKKSSTT